MKKRWFQFSVIVVLFSLFLFQNVKLAEDYHKKYGMTGVIWSDAYSYYEYLPDFFIRHKPTRFKSGMPIRPGFSLNKVTYGVSVLEAPFFLANYQLQTWRGDVGTGFENSYGYAILIAASTYTFLGLWMVFTLLRKWFNVATAIISVIGIYYGTNMFHYCYAEPGISHVYSFFCASGLLFFTDRFYQRPRFGLIFLAITVFMALIVLIRPINIIMVLVFALYNCYSLADIKARLRLLFLAPSGLWIIPVFALVGFIVFIPQMYYWHMIMDSWIVSPYTINNEHFEYLSSPKIAEALFSQKGGWFTYSQIMLISIGALPFMIYQKKFNGWMILIVFLLILYICSSWWAINFMCAHGYRSFIDYYAIFIIPFAWLFYTVITRTPRWAQISYSLVVLILIYFACCFNLDFSIVRSCVDESYTFYEYIKLYDNYF